MNLKKLQSYNFVSIQTWCCIEFTKMVRLFPLLFVDHHVDRISAPTRKINLKFKVRMGELEDKIHNFILNIDIKRKQHKQYCVNFVPLFSIMWIQQYKTVSPYLIKEAITLFKNIDLLIIPGRENMFGRNGDKSWFVKSKKVKDLENNVSINIADLLYENDIDYISLNKLLKMARENNLWK